jgi:lysyl-tRNA synthetase class 2
MNKYFSAGYEEFRAVLYKTIRNFFDSSDFLEVETPILVKEPIPESHIDLFKTELIYTGTYNSESAGDKKENYYLVPSPEVYMKLMLSEGFPSVYQISKSFRNSEPEEKWHLHEFSMLEWYKTGINYEDNIIIAQNLVSACAETISRNTHLKPAEAIAGSFTVMTMEEAFLEFAGFSLEKDLTKAGAAETDKSKKEYSEILNNVRSVLNARLTEKGHSRAQGDAADVFHTLYLTYVEDKLPRRGTVILKDWPDIVPTLARRKKGTPWSERWEMYINGVETANCYSEETDREQLYAYWESENNQINNNKDGSGKKNYWIEKVASGMPECSGTAMGLDRLLAVLTGKNGIR